MCYYAINNLVAQEFPLTHPKDVLLSNFEYVIQRTHIADNNGNWHFEITDPSGMSDEEIGVIQRIPNVGTEGFISFTGISLNSLNLGFEFFRKLSLYKNWYHFLLSNEAGNFSTDQILRFRNLEIKCEELENKLTRISDIIN